ncbi:DNA-directed RNA polymerase III subunit RPC4 isoform X2 [Danaus plexippus]|uniref:DNA-directed RNA polymerase III subunit RPC4 isoform X2 n=1 Tax=Danaus plexippus TaxID=13037 RepID=UPI0013C51253|nr:DNA-directed RNA polymerase III subunit RPC4 isoform X2 [Danaus plexippus]
MSNSGDKPNANGVNTDPLQRLASFKAPRDLSLGGLKPNKKIFTPNLNVTRNKNKGASSTSNRDSKKDERNRRDRKNDKNKNFKNGPNIIKSSGVFSEGLGSAERHHSSRVSYGRDVDSSHTLQKPTLRVKDVVKIDKELEEQKIQEAFGENNAFDDEGEDFKQVLDIEAPIKLPMDDGTAVLEQKPLADVKEVYEDSSVMNLLRSDKPTLILLQLADSLPGRGGASDDRKHEPGTSEAAEQETDSRCHLTDLEEGRIGKMRIHRSGRVTMALGDTIFEVSAGTKASFHQEVVSVGVDEASRSASLVSLGPLHHKLNITPHWQSMFNKMSV